MPGKTVDPADHPDKDIRGWLEDPCDTGWTLHKEGHKFRLYCPCGCTTIPIPGTAGGNKKRLRLKIVSKVQRCPLPEGDPRRSLTGMDREQ